MNRPRCECGAFHAPDAPFCERCGAQPPKPKNNRRLRTEPMPAEEAEAFVAGCVVLGEALAGTRGKWGVA